MAVASAQVAHIGVARAANTGRDGEAAARQAALISLGKKSVMYRFGNAQNERSGAVEELEAILLGDGRRFFHPWPEVVAATALHELTFDRCGVCFGRGEVPDHSGAETIGRQPMRECGECKGQKRVRHNEDARVLTMARHFVATTKIKHESIAEYEEHVTISGTVLRKSKEFRELVNAVDYCKHVLIEAERAAVEGAAVALGRMKAGE